MTTIPTVKGGDYRARKAADGTWTVLGVPIFATCERTVTAPNGVKITAKFDRAWQEKAVSRARAKHADSGVMRAIYPKHKATAGESRDVLGFFLPSEVRDVEIGGKRTAVTFADYVGVSDAAYQELKSRKHPYKSVEAPVGTEPEFTGLAWLKEPPFHDDFPIQTVSEFGSIETGTGVVAFSNDAATVSALVRFAMPDVTEEPAADPKPKNGAPPVTDPTKAPAPAAPPGIEPEAKTNPTDELGAKIDSLASLMTVVIGLMAKLSGGTQGDPMAGGGNRPSPVVNAFQAGDTPVADPTPAATVTFNAENFAKLQSDLTAERAKTADFAKAEAKRSALADANAKLVGHAHGLTEADLIACFDATGKVGLDQVVAAVTKIAPKEPPKDWAGSDPSKRVTDPIVTQFAGHEDAVTKFGADFDALPVSLRGGITREAWITTNLGYVGIKPEATK